jgi:hypothetical protein
MNTEKKLSDYLPFYLGVKCATRDSNIAGTLIQVNIVTSLCHLMINNQKDYISKPFSEITPHFRRLSSMTEEDVKDEQLLEIIELFHEAKLIHKKKGYTLYTPNQFAWLCKKGFWLWDESWFTEGLIIDADTIK